jgi:cytochrome c-type biogenesis protein CcmH/NrfF
MKRLLQLVAIISLGLLLGADPKTQRFEKVGHALVCTCGCNQILLECNHVGCPASEGMRQDLTARLEKGETNDQILTAFSDKFGPTVLAAPTTKGFNLLAWVAPPIALSIGIGLAIVFVRSWSKRPLEEFVAAGVAPADIDALRARARQETEL